MRYNAGQESLLSEALIEGTRLSLDPDFVLKRKDTIPVTSTYERADEQAAEADGDNRYDEELPKPCG
jgi:hypothetical protein